MSPTFVFSCLPSELKDRLSGIQTNHFPGITLVFVDSFSNLRKYFSREEPYCSRNHPAPHLAVIYSSGSVSESDICAFLNNPETKNPPILLLGKDLNQPSSLAKADLPFTGVIDLENDPELDSTLADMLAYWSDVVKLPLV